MKRYIFGMIAVVIAVGAAAFTAPKKPTVDMYVFEYNGSLGYAPASIQNTDNDHWIYQGKNLSLCSNTNAKACRVAVTSSYVDNPTTPTELSGIAISTSAGSTAYVTGITNAPTNQFSNKP